MKKLIVCSVLVLVTSAVYGQEINQLDSAGKKHGKWVVWLNVYWDEVKDSSNAAFCMYTMYDHGKDFFRMSGYGRNGWKCEKTGGTTRYIGSKEMLDGTYTWLDKKGRKSSSHTFSNGEYVNFAMYGIAGGIIEQFDCTKKWKNMPNTYFYRNFNSKGVCTYEGYFRHGNKGWAVYPEEKK